jgi:hypothetical protein
MTERGDGTEQARSQERLSASWPIFRCLQRLDEALDRREDQHRTDHRGRLRLGNDGVQSPERVVPVAGGHAAGEGDEREGRRPPALTHIPGFYLRLSMRPTYGVAIRATICC